MPRTASELVAEAGTDIREIAPQDYATHRVDGVLIDARDPALSHKDQFVTIHCRTGGRAALAAQSLQRMDFPDVCSISGGITQWAAVGLPVTAR